MLWRDEISRLKADVNSPEYQSAMAKLSNVPVLYIDDFFKVKTLPTDADMQIMFQIINNRYIRRLTTIFSSELSVRRITELDEAMGSRINQMVGEYAVFIKPDTTKNMRNGL
jgi:DNA replication protein DnaC